MHNKKRASFNTRPPPPINQSIRRLPITMDLLTHFVSLMGLFTLAHTFIPPQLRQYLHQLITSYSTRFFSLAAPFTFIDVPQYRGDRGFDRNHLYAHLELYISSLQHAFSTQRLNVYRSQPNTPLTFTLAANETIEDTFQGAPLWWTYNSEQRESNKGEDRKSFSLKILKTDRALLLSEYFDHISRTAEGIERLNTQRHLYTNCDGEWEDVPFNHPSTFDTLALDPKLKDRIKADLQAFIGGEDYYHQVGRAWKRGYLLYGPPGTGKSSMIAAMANHLNYDVYDLELTKVCDNSSLRSLLLQTTKKSLIIIEDIDCTIDLSDRLTKVARKCRSLEDDESDEEQSSAEESARTGVTLSGLLNFTDGLWSCCGEERIIVFTTNHKERLDPALLRSGRMDFHILLSHCSFPAFKVLARNYLGIKDHKLLYPLVEKEMESGAKLTPAEIGELLIEKKQNPEAALSAVIHALRCKDSAAPAANDECVKDGWEISADCVRMKRGRKGRLEFLRQLTKNKPK